MCSRIAIINHGKIVAMDSPEKLSITAGRVYLVDVSFDKPVSKEILSALPGVNRVETAQDIEAAERLRTQQAMANASKQGGMAGQRPTPQGQMAGNTAPAAAANKPQGMVPGKETDKIFRVRLYASDTTTLICSLVDFSRSQSLQMNILNVRPPSLEDAFVRLTEEKSHGK
jgi:ABC-type multidrug transport system ATPase subunit